MKKCMLIAIIAILLPIKAFAYDTEDIINKTASSLSETVGVGSEWLIIGAVGGGAENADKLAERYINAASEYLKENNGILHERRYTEYSRMVIALETIGENSRDFAGFNIAFPLGDYEKTVMQGLNGSIWALTALNSAECEAPKNSGAAIQATKSMYLENILSSQNDDGGWALTNGGESDIDITAMALCAIADYSAEENVSDAVEKALMYISEKQNENGGFYSWGNESSESAAQVLTALCALGISEKDSRFVKNGKTVFDNLMSYYDGNGGFYHTHNDEQTNIIATQQALCAVAAYKRYSEGKSFLYGGNQTGFFDIADIPEKSKIEYLAENGIISGKSKYSFDPDNFVTRAEFACIAVKALGISAEGADCFSDVSESDWYYPYIFAAYKAEIVSGVSETEFNPHGNITLEEAAAMICRAADFRGKYSEADNLVNIQNASEWAIKPLAFCAENGILQDGLKDAKKVISRAVTADMIYNLLQL